MLDRDDFLLRLRGSFYYPVQALSPSFLSPKLGEMIDFFPITDEHAIVVSQKSVHLLHLSSREIFWSIFVDKIIIAAGLAPDQPLLALALSEEIVVWDMSSGQTIQHLVRPFVGSEACDLTFGTQGMFAHVPLYGGVQLWNAGTGQMLFTLMDENQWYSESPKNLAFSPDGAFLAVGHADGSDVWLWRVVDGHLYQMMETHSLSQRIRGLAFSPNGKWLVGSEWSTDPEEESMPIWEIPTGTRIDQLPFMGWLPAVSPNGSSIGFVTDDFISLWSVEKRAITWQTSYNECTKLLFSPGGRFLIYFNAAGAVWLNVQDGQEAYRLRCYEIATAKVFG